MIKNTKSKDRIHLLQKIRKMKIKSFRMMILTMNSMVMMIENYIF